MALPEMAGYSVGVTKGVRRLSVERIELPTNEARCGEATNPALSGPHALPQRGRVSDDKWARSDRNTNGFQSIGFSVACAAYGIDVLASRLPTR